MSAQDAKSTRRRARSRGRKRQGNTKPAEESSAASTWKNRIVGEGLEPADQLLANPKNWRIHPRNQQKALEGLLDQVGWVQRVIVNKRTGFVVDGHARVALAISRGESVPVIYVDLSDDEERLILASIDPISAMAVPDAELLAGLVADLPTVQSAELEDLLKATAPTRMRADDDNDQSELCSDDYMVLIECEDETQQTELLQRFQEEGLKCRALIS